jgi:hypothetical protein
MNPVTIRAQRFNRKPFHRPTLGDLMRRNGPAWAAECIGRRYRIHPRHAALVVGMLGVAECRR